jgi:folate-binding protein YgfZ
MSDRPNAIAAVTGRVAWIDRSARVRLDVTGPDRAKFLHNLTTSDVKRLPAGRGCEAFVTSPQGKTLGYVLLHVADDRILLRTDPGGLVHILPHFQKYGLFDEVAWDDASERTFEHHLAGRQSAPLLAALGVSVPADGELSHATGSFAGCAVSIIRESPTGHAGLTLIGPLDDASKVAESLRQAGEDFGLVELDADTFEALRIAAGTPVFGRDVTADNLPQEVGRDARAISFVKGCYLGQETVARIDALGHVNKLLKGLRFDTDEPPPAGTALEADGKAVGTVTSSSPSPAGRRPIGLGYVRTAFAQPGTVLRVAGGTASADVVDFPIGEDGRSTDPV